MTGVSSPSPTSHPPKTTAPQLGSKKMPNMYKKAHSPHTELGNAVYPRVCTRVATAHLCTWAHTHVCRQHTWECTLTLTGTHTQHRNTCAETHVCAHAHALTPAQHTWVCVSSTRAHRHKHACVRSSTRTRACGHTHARTRTPARTDVHTARPAHAHTHCGGVTLHRVLPSCQAEVALAVGQPLPLPQAVLVLRAHLPFTCPHTF